MSDSIEARIDAASPFAEVIERAYRTFQPPVPEETEGCECCWSEEIQRDFFNHGQRGQPFEYLTEWFSAAVAPEISKGLWSWLLPRVLEALAADEPPATVGVEVSLSRFPTGDKSRWSPEEWEVLDDFRRLYIEHVHVDSGDFLDDILCMFALAGWSVDELFAQVYEWPTERLVEHLHGNWNPRAGHMSIWTTTFWPDVSESLSRWSDPALGQRFMKWSHEPERSESEALKARALAEAIDIFKGL